MIIEGEKYACEACVRGHRVSSCNHHDRKLLHVNKKGRPVSQCPHCRSLRKSRAQHVKCECQDKTHAKEDCPHLQSEGTVDKNLCCCPHGAKCICALKKEHGLDAVPENLSTMLEGKNNDVRAKHKDHGPNVNDHTSRPLQVINGHHKPVHKFNDAHNHCGAPYRIPARANSHHGNQTHREIAQRSHDNLPLTSKPQPHHESPLHTVMNATQPVRKVRSAHNSPLLEPSPLTQPQADYIQIPSLPPGAYAYTPFDVKSPGPGAIEPPSWAGHLPDPVPDHWFTTQQDVLDKGHPDNSKLPFVDWTNYGYYDHLDQNNPINKAYPSGQMTMNATQMPRYMMHMDYLNPATPTGLSTPSGSSEIDELPAHLLHRPLNYRSVSSMSHEISSPNTNDTQRLSTTSSYFSNPALTALADPPDDLDIDAFLAENRKYPLQPQTMTPNTTTTPYESYLNDGIRTPDLSQIDLQQHPRQTIPTPPPSSKPMSMSPIQAKPMPRGYSVTSQPLSEHSYTIEEAQKQAHKDPPCEERNVLDEWTRQDSKPALTSMYSFEDPSLADDYLTRVEAGEFGLDSEAEEGLWRR